MATPIPANPLTKTHKPSSCVLISLMSVAYRTEALFIFARRGSLILVVINKRNLGVGAQCLFEKTARVLTGRFFYSTFGFSCRQRLRTYDTVNGFSWRSCPRQPFS